MSNRPIAQLIRSVSVSEGAGVTVHRSLGTPRLQHLDPFLMLDHFGTDRPEEYIAGFPDHPHRGFITLTYMLDGHMLHQDSMGNRGDLKAGGAQWMKAASGVIHSEMPQQTNGLMRGFQLWINLPASEKMSAPAYQEIQPDAVPVHETDGVQVRVLSGEYAGVRGPLEDPFTQLQYLDVTLAGGERFEHAPAKELTVFAYVFEGAIAFNDEPVAKHHLVVFGAGDRIGATAGAEGGRFILVAGRPLGEPIVQYGPFVMNSREEIEQAFSDYRDGRLVRAKAEVAEV